MLRAPKPHLANLLRTAALTLALLAASACQPAPASDAVAPDQEAVELATLMGEMQRHSAKLGFAIDGQNRPLADFYLHEVEEVLAELSTIELHDGMPIAHPARTILTPTIEALEAALDTGRWPAAWQGYTAVIDGCNRCHLATEHGFIEILPATGPAPYNQRFAAAGTDRNDAPVTPATP